MKRFCLIGAILCLALAACHRPVETVCTPSLPELVAIDSLMQTRPDSALALLQASPVDEPYYQLLLSEALYKNDSTQLNRPELLEAMAYYDSLDCPFLSARCHYMNGVGYYEMDSVVEACGEYLKALEIMEEHFKEKDLVGYKAKFMALTYTRLTVLFSDQYLHEQAIYFGRGSLSYYQRYNVEPWHLVWMFENNGSQYHMMKQWDSADYYYNKAIDYLPDTNSLIYRDIAAAQSLLSFHIGNVKKQSLGKMYRLLLEAETKQEYLARCLNISEIYYHEQLYDTAWFYLNKVFFESSNIESRKQAAEWLVEICKIRRESTEIYSEFLVPFANKEENKSLTKSILTELYNNHCQKVMECRHQQETKENKKSTRAILVGSLCLTLIILVFYIKKKTKLVSLESQIKEDQSFINKRNRLEEFLREEVCQAIILSVQQENIKRSSIPADYPELILNDTQLRQLGLTVSNYFGSFEKQLEQRRINSNPNLVNLCHLYLLGINETQAAILLNKDYSTITRYNKKLKNAFGTSENLVVFLRNFLLNS